jgi:sugar lactone lactonase YvrE
MKSLLIIALFSFFLASCDKPENTDASERNTPVISSFNPSSGAIGTEVTIIGQFFDVDKSKNAVKFNGTAAIVIDATTSQLKVTVPAGATTGKISVTVDSKTGNSTTDYTVTGDQLSITTVTPDRAEGGTVTINGSGFVNAPAGISVRFGTLTATIQTATSTSTKLVVDLPANMPAGEYDVTVIANNQVVTKSKAFHLSGWMVKRVAGTGANGTTDGPGLTATFTNPEAMAVDKNKNIYIIDGNKIRKLAPDGNVTTVAGTGALGSTDGDAITQATFRSPAALAVDNAGNIYVADEGNHVIRMINTQGNVSTLAGVMLTSGTADGIGQNANFNKPRGIAVDAQGQFVYVSDWSNHKIRRIHVPTREVTSFAGGNGQTNADGTGTNASILFPGNLTLHTDGTLYVCQSNSARIRKINTTTAAVTTFIDNLVRDAPNNIVIDNNKNAYVLTSGIGQLSKYNENGQQVVISFAGSQIVNDADGAATTVSFRNPTGLQLVVDAQAQPIIYIADTGNKKIKTIRYE